MDKTQLGDLVKSLMPDVEVKEGKQYAEVLVSPALLHELAGKLKVNEAASFDYLISITGVDLGKDLGVTYHMSSTKHRHIIVVKTRVSDRENPVVDSVCDLWATAEFQEREVYDLLGVKFNNHPDLRRLFLDSSWGFPLRKDYVDDINIVSK
ncbi:MAG: NADH-quinone oxidoreductase subunit C [Bacteroidales bacterium]